MSATYTLTDATGRTARRSSDGLFIPWDSGSNRPADLGGLVTQQWIADGSPSAVPFAAAAYVPQEVPLWAARSVLRTQGIFDAVDATIEAERASNPTQWEAWNMGNSMFRDSPLMASFALRFGLSTAQVDALFVAAAALKV